MKKETIPYSCYEDPDFYRKDIKSLEEEKNRVVENLIKIGIDIEANKRKTCELEESKLNEIKKLVLNKINIDDVFEKPGEIIDIFKKENIITDLKIKDDRQPIVDSKTKGLFIFKNLNSGTMSDNKLFTEYHYFPIFTQKDEDFVKSTMERATIDKKQEFISEEENIVIVFTQYRKLR